MGSPAFVCLSLSKPHFSSLVICFVITGAGVDPRGGLERGPLVLPCATTQRRGYAAVAARFRGLSCIFLFLLLVFLLVFVLLLHATADIMYTHIHSHTHTHTEIDTPRHTQTVTYSRAYTHAHTQTRKLSPPTSALPYPCLPTAPASMHTLHLLRITSPPKPPTLR